MVRVPDHRNRIKTFDIQELTYGASLLRYGASQLTFGVPLPLPTQPEKIIVRAAWEIGIPAYAVYQPGGVSILPSIIFQATGIIENETFARGLESQSFLIEVRAKRYEETVDLSNRFYESIRQIAGSRWNGLDGSWSDEYSSDLSYRARSFSINLRR